MSNLFSSIFGDDEADTSAASGGLEDEAKKAKALRSALYATAGGSAGQELMTGQTQRRNTLLGN